MKAQISQLKRALHKHPEVFPYLADCYFKIGKTKEAGSILTKGLDQYPENYMGWIVRGNVYREMGELEQAEDAFERALQHDNNIPFAHEQCGELALESGKVELYASHLKILNHLVPMDGNIQGMLQIQAMRLLAVENGLYTEESVQEVMPGTLRQKLKNNNLLPQDIERRSPRKRTQPFKLPTTQTMTEEDMMIDASHVVDEAEAPSIPKTEFREELSPDLLVHNEPNASDQPIEISGDDPETLEKIEAENLRYPLGRSELGGLGGTSTKVSWAETIVPQDGSPLVEVSSDEPDDVADEDLVVGKGESRPVGEDDTIVGSELQNEQEVEPRDSPIMRLLRGEMQDKPISRDLHFRRDRMEVRDDAADSALASPIVEKDQSSDIPETSKSDIGEQSAASAPPQHNEPSPFIADIPKAAESSPPDLIIPADPPEWTPALEETESVESDEESVEAETPSELSLTAQPAESEQDDAEYPPVDKPQDASEEQPGFSLDSLQVGDQPEISPTTDDPPQVDPPEALSAFSGEIKISSDDEVPVRAEFGEDVPDSEQKEDAITDAEQALTSSEATSTPDTEAEDTPDTVFASAQENEPMKPMLDNISTYGDEFVSASDASESEVEAPESIEQDEIESESAEADEGVDYPTIQQISPQDQILDDSEENTEATTPYTTTSFASEEVETLEDSEDKPEAGSPDITTGFVSEAEETPPESAAVDDDQSGVEQHSELAEVARDVTEARDTAEEKPPPPSEPSGEKRIATKTLAELHASQENWTEAIEVYEELLQRFPTNIAYQKRVKELKAKRNMGNS